jgi:hypothetical protein
VTGHGSSSVATTPIEWREGIRLRVDQLGRYIEGRFLPGPNPDVEAVPAERFLDDEYLEKVMTQAAGAEAAAAAVAAGRNGPAALEFHAGVSRFVRHYTGSLSIAALVGLAEGIGLDVSPMHCTMIMWKDVPFRIIVDLPDSDVLRCEERSTSLLAEGPVLETLAELRTHVWHALYGEHIGPLIARVADITGISTALLWTNTAEWVGVISQAAREYLGEESAQPFMADQQAILVAGRLPGVDNDVNPLRDRLDWTPLERDSYPYELATRRLCCLTYMLDDRSGRLCASCPQLPLDEKIALVLERHGVPADAPGGEAEKQATERGLQRPSMRKVLQAKQRRRGEQPG